jgi:hypothetical protein
MENAGDLPLVNQRNRGQKVAWKENCVRLQQYALKTTGNGCKQ